MNVPKLVFVTLLLLSSVAAEAQCMVYPVSLEQRVNHAAYIVEGKIIDKKPYLDKKTGLVYTLNTISINAWLKNSSKESSIYLITEGGFFEDRGTIVYPSLQVQKNQEYIFFLEPDNHAIDNKELRQSLPGKLQAKAYADGQGVLTNMNNSYKDLLSEPLQSEAAILEKIQKITGTPATTPAGAIFRARETNAGISANRMNAITGISPATTNAGTINPSDNITITGSGFGAAAGTVYFSNADDGGATLISSGVASDIISWSDGSITAKVARGAGTGPINVNGSFTSPGNLTVNYAHLDINSSFSGFGSSTRQRYYLRNLNGAGGYTFLYETGFSGNAPAVAAFERALETWRCSAGVNFVTGGTTSTATVSADGTNAVFFDASLPSGVLGRATSQYSGSAIPGVCDLSNTVWWLSGVDVQFTPDPPFPGYTWQFGPGSPSGTQFDFESVSVHELGHALGLGHRIALGDVMHYALSNGAAVRTPSATEIAGANAKMAYSTVATCFNPGSSGTQMTAATCSSLPVTMLDFTGAAVNKNILLKWSTVHEQNARNFELERSADGRSFHMLGTVNAAGNSNTERSYSYTDIKPGENNYYRLKMVDADGGYVYSKTIYIKMTGAEQAVWIGNNPFSSVIDIRLAKLPSSKVTFELVNVTGATVYKTQKEIANEYSLPVSSLNLGKGVYILKTNVDGTVYTNKLVKQ